MERLTKRDINYCSDICASQNCGTYHGYTSVLCDDAEIYYKLAKYEDTGLEPLEVRSLLGEWRVNLAALEWYRNAEAEKRLFIMPCKIGDKVRDSTGHIFTVKKAEMFTYGGDVSMLFRCGNDGTDDYMAFSADEIGDRIRIVTDEEYREGAV